MDVKSAVKNAKEYVADLLSEEGVKLISLEEVVFDDVNGTWNITLGMFRKTHIDTINNSLAALVRQDFEKNYKIITLRDYDGTIISMKNR